MRPLVWSAPARYKSAHKMIFGRPQVGLDAAVSAGGRGRTPALSARARVSAAEKFGIFSYTPVTSSYPTSVPVLSNEIRISNVLISSLTFLWPAALTLSLVAVTHLLRARCSSGMARSGRGDADSCS